ncbi:F-box/LRR-repeat protein At3g59200-like [Prunus avium]|uniref:F-box/LRR-repeat protein At3g59200-like n=1 Tax=Prunus avium TaxID=42229 RepID=A0A6P5SME5_PRUAV|nr:F-box/LRR-repeat protein At3g59200-like [Prunus avium]
MGSKSKPLRLKKKSKREEIVKDRISELPDSILCHMLSFIPTKYAVRTCILSTKWKSIWASVPNLDFEYRDDFVLWSHEYDYESHAGFFTFVDRVLSCRDLLDIKKCRLHCDCREEDFSRIDGWIRTVSRHNVVELDLDVKIGLDEDIDPPLELPQCVFMCKTLVVLKVNSNCITYTTPTSGCFPSLKFLHVSVEYPDNDSMEEIFSCCPVLECLTINGILGLDDVLNFNISVPELRTLRLELELSNDYDVDIKHTFFVNCPKLESLDIKQDILSNYLFENVKPWSKKMSISGTVLRTKSLEFYLISDMNGNLFRVWQIEMNHMFEKPELVEMVGIEMLELLQMVGIEKHELLVMVGIEKPAVVEIVGIEKPRLL